MKPIIAPSILSADFGYLAKDIEMVNRSEAEWVHIDIMDGVFVPNIFIHRYSGSIIMAIFRFSGGGRR